MIRAGASNRITTRAADFLVPVSGPEQTAISRYVKCWGGSGEDWHVCNPDRRPAVLLHSRILHRDRDRGCESIGWLRLTSCLGLGSGRGKSLRVSSRRTPPECFPAGGVLSRQRCGDRQ